MSTHDRLVDPFHPGEVAVQTRAGERAMALRVGGMLAPSISANSLPFLACQRTVALGVADDNGVWAALWVGDPGFVSSEDGRTVRIDRTRTTPFSLDPALSALSPGRSLGMLAIDLFTRKRLRINGVVRTLEPASLELEVREVFANCPKYIQKRDVIRAELPSCVAPSVEGDELTVAQRALVERVDTAFVASLHPERGADVSHRGGEPGFVRVLGPRMLRIPDYPGNGMFQTLGNLTINPRAGLLLVDFQDLRVLSLTGTARIDFGDERPTHPSGGTGRYWELAIRRFCEMPLALAGSAEVVERSPFNPATAPQRTVG